MQSEAQGGTRVVGTRSTTWLSVTLVIALALVATSVVPAAGELENRVGTFVGSATRTVNSIVRPASELLLSAGELRTLAVENIDLEFQISRLSAEVATLREERAASEQVTALLEAVSVYENREGSLTTGTIPAAVLAPDPSPTRESLLINRGSTHGVRVGQPVLGPAATLVGIVTKVDERSSHVRLLIDARSAVTAVVQGSRTPGALAGGNEGLHLELIPLNAPITIGDVVLTSALGGQLPAGLLAGRITAVHTKPHDLFATVVVEPLVDYARLEQLLVLITHPPGAVQYPLATP